MAEIPAMKPRRDERQWPMLWNLLGPQRRLVPFVVLLGLVAAALEGVGIGLIIPMLGVIAGEHGTQKLGGLSAVFQRIGAGMNGNERLILIALGIFAIVTLKNLLVFCNSVLTAFIYGKAGHAIRGSLAGRLLEIGHAFFLKESPGRLLNILSNESWRVSDAVQIALAAIVSASAAFILLVFLLLISWQMTLLVASGLALIQLAHAALSASLKAQSRKLTSRNGELASMMLHLVHAGRLIRIFGQEERERSKFDSVSDVVRREGFGLLFRQALLPPMTESLHALLFLAVVVGAWFAGLGFPLIVAFVVLLYRMQPHVRALQMSISHLRGLSGSIEDVKWLLDPTGKPEPPRGSEPLRIPVECISFESVGFRYPGAAPRQSVLNSVSFSIRGGRSTAIIGRSGAGKSTIVNLLCRFLEPDEGSILVDGRPLDRIDPVQWRSRIALASQELELVDGTILENITYGQGRQAPMDAMKAARLAEAHEFIEALPRGYETVVGYRGVNLSAGQRQRIALARALVRDPEVLILDEATNAVDGLSEAAIVETLKQGAGRRSTVVISHHRSTIAFCDDVVVMESGTIKRQAALAELDSLSMDELYELAPSG